MPKIESGFLGSRAIVLPRSIVDEQDRDAICSNLHITDIGYYPLAKYHYVQRKLPIDQYVMLYCVGGEGWVNIGGKTHVLQEDQIIILPQGVPHEYGSSEANPWTIYWIHFRGKLAQYLAKGFDSPCTISASNDSRIAYRLELFEELYRTLSFGYSIENLRYTTTCFFYFLGSITFLSRFRATHIGEYCGSDMVPQSIHYMKENLYKSLTLSDVAAYVKMSPSYFSTIFRQQTGYSPMNYFSRLKIQKACEYLDTTDLKVNQISQMLGFEDQFYFSRVFSKIMGVSPSSFKNRDHSAQNYLY